MPSPTAKTLANHRLDIEAAAIRKAPPPYTATTNVRLCGIRFWTTVTPITPAATPTPTTVSRTPNPADPARRTCFEKTDPKGTTAPPPASPQVKPMSTALTTLLLPMRRNPSLTSRKTRPTSRVPSDETALVALCGNASVVIVSADRKKVPTSNQMANDSCANLWTPNVPLNSLASFTSPANAAAEM